MNHPYRGVDISTFPAVKHRQKSKPELIWVRLDELVFDNRYQRDIERQGRGNILKIANDFDWGRFTPLLVAHVGDNQMAVIDGQHRAHAAALCGYIEVPAMSVPMSLADQAKAFSWVNGNVTNVSSFHILKAALAAEEPWAVKSKKAVNLANCDLMLSNASTEAKKPKQVYCIVAIRRLIEQGQSDVVTKALRALGQSHAGEIAYMYSGTVLVPWFVAVRRAGDVSIADLAAFIDANPFDKILRKVEQLRSTPEYFTKSRKTLFEDSLTVLFKQFLKERGE